MLAPVTVRGPLCFVGAGWTSDIPVIAYMVTIRDAAAPDKHGLLQPVLKRWQAGGCSYSAFALPPIQVIVSPLPMGHSLLCRHALALSLALPG
jgi:hypothetical protein